MKTIAIIDDDIYIGDMIEEVLQREGYGVMRGYSGTEAVLLLSKSRPDLILLDLMLPGMSGEEVLTKLEGIPVIVLSAKVSTRDKVNLLRSGAVDYLSKPFDLDELIARIDVQFRKIRVNQNEIIRVKLFICVCSPIDKSHLKAFNNIVPYYRNWLFILT